MPVILIHSDAPPKPQAGQPCNGCGVCCISEPCPVGVLASRRRHGRCDALKWSDAEARYRCGLADGSALDLPAPWAAARPLLARLARRFIAAGVGCDCELRVGEADEV